jgi:hypothetical protein
VHDVCLPDLVAEPAAYRHAAGRLFVVDLP